MRCIGINCRVIEDGDIDIDDNWIIVSGVGRIGLYSPSDKMILLDYSMKWIVGSNERITSNGSLYDIRNKIKLLFNGV